MKNRIQTRILELMKMREMTQSQLAEKAGLNKMTISKIVRGGNADLETLYKLEDALGAKIIIVSNEELK